MKTGFTGTQRGMTAAQKRVVETFIRNIKGEFHHGDCIGADEEAHEIALGHGLKIVIHPPANTKKRAFCEDATDLRIEKSYLSRNKDIVLETEQLIAAPGEEEEQTRSGTWSTVRYARSLKRVISIVLPDGRTIVENGIVPLAPAERGE
jgi:hypothetical protein